SLRRGGRLTDDLARVEVDVCRIRHRDHADLTRLARELLGRAQALVGLGERLALLGEPLRLGLQARDLVAGVRHLDVQDRKSTRLNSSHVSISYAVFCLKKKKTS